MKLETIKKLVAISSLVTMLPFTAFAANTTENFTPTAGSLSVTSPETVTVSAVAVNIADTNPTAEFSPITTTDTRGTLVGWTTSMTSANVVKQLTAVAVSGTTPTDRIGFSGTYTGVVRHTTNSASRYRVEITTGGDVGTAVFKWLAPTDTETASITTAASVLLDSGISATFTGTQVVGDAIALRVGLLRYTDLTMTPADLAATSGSLSGIALSGGAALTGAGATSGSKTIVVAEVGAGGGEFTNDIDVTSTWKKNGLSGLHSGLAVITTA